MGRQQVVEKGLSDKASSRRAPPDDRHRPDRRSRQRRAPRRRRTEAISLARRQAGAALGRRVPDRTSGAIRDIAAQRSTGLPPSKRYCFSTPPPRRSPLPAATIRAVTVIRAALYGCLPCPPRAVSTICRAFHERAEAHLDRSGTDRRAGDPGADDGGHRPAVPAGRQALRRRANGQRDDRQPGDGPRNPPVAAEGACGTRPRSRCRCSSPAASRM